MRCPGDQCVRASGQDDDAARIAASTSASSVADDAVVTFANPAPAAARAIVDLRHAVEAKPRGVTSTQ